MMKRSKDEGKIMGPMFPRLHVNDAEKGWPKAPPRNKMALYEQLSIPSQRFNHPNNTNTAQGGENERGLFFSHQPPPMHQSEKQYCQFPNFSTSMAQVERRKKSDEDDFRVPIFVDSFTDKEKLSPSNPSYSNPTLKFPKAKRANVEKNESRNERNDLRHEQTDIPGNGIDRLKNDDSVQSEVLGENMSTLENIYSFDSVMECASEDQNIADNLGNDRESHEDTSSKKIGKLERGDSGVSETSVLDSISGPDITPDDVVAIIGQKRFWKARRAIANQQRVFAVQVFELHRLIKVQKLIAASPHLSLEDLVPIKPSPRKRPASDYPIKPIPDVSKPKDDSDMPSHAKESSAENTLEKSSFSSIQKGLVPSSYKPTAAHSPGLSDQKARSWGFNQPQPNHWLIPVMSPSEGLVYKPYPAPGAASPTCGPMPMGNFPTPVFGLPAPHLQYQFPYPYGMPIMNAPTFSTGSIEQMNRPDFPFQFGANMSIQPRTMFTMPAQRNEALPCRPEDTEVQASTASSPSERVQGRKASSNVEGRNVLPLFPTSPAQGPSSSSPPATDPVRPPQVIKVVPHNARSATESAARIFRSIQEERKQFDVV